MGKNTTIVELSRQENQQQTKPKDSEVGRGGHHPRRRLVRRVRIYRRRTVHAWLLRDHNVVVMRPVIVEEGLACMF